MSVESNLLVVNFWGWCCDLPLSNMSLLLPSELSVSDALLFLRFLTLVAVVRDAVVALIVAVSHVVAMSCRCQTTYLPGSLC